MKFEKKKDVSRDFYEATERQITLLVAGREKPWLAKITGFDNQYGYKREFLEPVDTKQRCNWYNAEEGQIYNWNEGDGQFFGIIENDKLYEISKTDVNNLLKSIKRGE